MNETHGFSKQYATRICINELISLHFGVLHGYITWIFLRPNVTDQITEGQ